MGSRLSIVLNPASGPTRTRGIDWRWLEQAAREADWDPELVVSQAPGDVERYVRAAVRNQVGRVIVVGGDGSINEALQPLAGSGVELGIIPAGTSNLLANELGLPADFSAAARIAFYGQSFDIDLGCANGRYFALMLGVGYDAVITETMWPQLKRLLGQAAYTLAGIQTFVKHRATRMVIQIDRGKKLRRLVYFLVAANTRLYGMAHTTVAEHADFRDGQIDLCLFRTRTWYHVVFALARILLGLSSPLAQIETVRCHRVVIRSARPVPYQLDGDPAGVLPVTAELRPRALRVVASELARCYH